MIAAARTGANRLADGATAMMRIATAFAIAMLTGCTSHYSAGDLAGRYVLSVDGGVDTIQLGTNGTYTHVYKAKSGQTDHQEGSWSLEDLQAGPTVALADFRPLLTESVRGRGFYLLLVKNSFGRVYLITNIDLGEGYKREP
jgi:hypothetical protein